MPAARPGGRRRHAAPARPRASARRRAARRRGLAHVLVAAVLLGLVAVAGLVVLAPRVVTGEPSLATPAAPRVSETAGTMLRISWRPVLFSDAYELTLTHGGTTEELRVEGTEVQVPNLSRATDYEVRVRAIREDDDAVQSKPSRAVPTRTEGEDHPELLVPANPQVETAGNTSLDLTWDPVTTARQYRVQLDSGDAFDDPRVVTTDETTATFTGLDADQPFVARVRALGEDGVESRWTKVLRTRTIRPDDPQPLAVGTYNVKCHSCGGPSWVSRRAAVAASIASHGLDVVGLQEAQQSEPRGVDGSQFDDLLRQLNAREGGWRLTDRRINGTLGTRIVYNTRAVRLVDAGSTRYSAQQSGSTFRQRFYTWAIFTQRTSGKDFLFVDTHLDPRSVPVRLQQARQLATDVARLRRNRPAVVVGDLNASQFQVYGVHEALKAAGFVEPLGIQRSSHAVGDDATVEKRINTHISSFNDYGTRPIQRASTDSNGTFIDYIVSTPMRVLEYEVVVDLDASGRFRGGPPSDHNMLRAVVGLP